MRVNLDMDILRTFVTAFELGSSARAADRLGRSPSAVSTQLRKLEQQIGRPLVKKEGRRLALTVAGEGLFSYARRLLELNDEAVATIRGSDLEGWARLGLPQDFAENWLPQVLSRFARAHPKVRVEVQVDRSVTLKDRTIKGELDLALAWGEDHEAPYVERVADVPIRWIGPRGWPGLAGLGGNALPFASFAPPCTFRTAAVKALDAAGLPWRLVFTSPSLSGLWAAAEAGLGITARAALAVPPALAVLDPAATELPALPTISLALHRAEADPGPAVQRLSDILIETIHSHIEPA